MKRYLRLFIITLLCAVTSVAWAADVTDVLTRDVTGVTGSSYAPWSDVKVTSDAVYAGQSAGGYESIQLRSSKNNSGIVTTASGGAVKTITVTCNSNTAAGRTLNIYGSNTAYSDPADLYNAETQGTLLGTIVNGESTTLNVEGNYAFIGIRSNSGGMYLEKIEITWSSASAPALAAPTFSPKAGTYYEPQSVTISCATEGASIYYTTNGADPTTSSTKYTAPINVSATTTIKAISVKGSEKSAVVSATYTIEELTSLANIAALSSQTEGGAYGVTFNNVVVTYVNGNYAYLQDASGAIVLYKSGHGLTAGQVLNGKAEVTFQLRNGNPQITALAGVSASDGTAPEPKTVAASAWNTPIATVLSQYFKVTGATITQDGNKFYVQLSSENVQLYGQADARNISAPDLNVTYTIIGFPTLYVKDDITTPELQIFAQPEAEGSVKPEAGLSYGEDVGTVTITIGEAYTLPTLINPNNLSVTYSSSDTNVATIDATGKVTVIAKGQTTIKAIFAGNDSYYAGEASYLLVVERPHLPVGTFFYETFNGLTGTGGHDGKFTGNIGSGRFNNADGTNTTDESWTSTTYSYAASQCARIGAGIASTLTTSAINMTGEGTLTFEAAGWGTGYNILDVSATGATLDGDTQVILTNGEWNTYIVSISGAQGEVVITFAGSRGFIDEIKVTTVRVAPELSYDEPATFTAALGEAFTAPPLNNPHRVTVTYSSSNESVATVDSNTGAVSLVAAGETTIRAIFKGNDVYYAGSASYKLTAILADPELSYNEPAKYDVVLGEPFTAPILNNQHGLPVTYSSSNNSVATVDANTGEITIVADGQTIITATSVANSTYDSGSASYTLTVIRTNLTVTIPEEGATTYCPSYDLDFSGINDFEAFVAACYDSGTVFMKRVDYAPAGLGIYLQGTPGEYVVPIKATSECEASLLVGTTYYEKYIGGTEGNMNNLVLERFFNEYYSHDQQTAPRKKRVPTQVNGNTNFYPITWDINVMPANSAWLQLPTSICSEEEVSVGFLEDESNPDLNKDGRITVTDVMMLVKIVLNN